MYENSLPFLFYQKQQRPINSDRQLGINHFKACSRIMLCTAPFPTLWRRARSPGWALTPQRGCDSMAGARAALPRLAPPPQLPGAHAAATWPCPRPSPQLGFPLPSQFTPAPRLDQITLSQSAELTPCPSPSLAQPSQFSPLFRASLPFLPSERTRLLQKARAGRFPGQREPALRNVLPPTRTLEAAPADLGSKCAEGWGCRAGCQDGHRVPRSGSGAGLDGSGVTLITACEALRVPGRTRSPASPGPLAFF